MLGPLSQPVTCHRCGHGYRQHQPACTATDGEPCGCTGFRWVDPLPAPDVRGYHRRSDVS